MLQWRTEKTMPPSTPYFAKRAAGTGTETGISSSLALAYLVLYSSHLSIIPHHTPSFIHSPIPLSAHHLGPGYTYRFDAQHTISFPKFPKRISIQRRCPCICICTCTCTPDFDSKPAWHGIALHCRSAMQVQAQYSTGQDRRARRQPGNEDACSLHQDMHTY